MKKVLVALFVALFVLGIGSAFSGCKGAENTNGLQSGSSSCEHTYEWVASEGGHQKVYTCGCPYPDIVELHIDNDGDYFCDVCNWLMQERPEPNVVYLFYFEEWLENISVDAIKEIKTTTEFIGVAPGRLKDVKRTTNRDVISRVVNEYKQLTMYYVPREEAEVEGGGAFTIEFVISSGHSRKIRFANGVYDGNQTNPELSSLQYYKPYGIPTLEGCENVTNSHSFVTYLDRFELFKTDGVLIGEFYGLDLYEFVELGFNEVPDMDGEPAYYIVGDVGKMYLCSENIFYMEKDGVPKYYQLVGRVRFDHLGSYALDKVADYVFEIISGLRVEDIQRVQTIKYAGSVSPDFRNPTEYKTSTLSDDIELIYNWLISLEEKVEISEDAGLIAGAGLTELYVYTTQGCFKISDVGRNNLRIYDSYFAQNGKTPEITGEEVSYRFESYHQETKLYMNGEWVKDYNFNIAEMVCVKSDFDLQGKIYMLVTDVGALYLFDERHFIRGDVKYEIIGDIDFSEIYEDFPIGGTEDILWVSSYPQDFEYNGLRYCLVRGAGQDTTATQEQIYALLGFIIREDDVLAFTQEYPGVYYLIDNGIYDYYLNNRVPFYSLKDYPDLSVICMKQNEGYALYQGLTDVYRVTIVDEKNRFFDKPDGVYFSAGTTITLRCNPIMDADLVMYVNGERADIQTSVWYEGEGFVWEYYFTVQEKDAVITFDIDGGM